jgi:hypothetical protein
VNYGCSLTEIRVVTESSFTNSVNSLNQTQVDFALSIAAMLLVFHPKC